jgi:hypothetical protein
MLAESLLHLPNARFKVQGVPTRVVTAEGAVLVGNVFRRLEEAEWTKLCSPSRNSDLRSQAVGAGGGRGIRTHEEQAPSGFQDRRHRPLGEPSHLRRICRGPALVGPARSEPAPVSHDPPRRQCACTATLCPRRPVRWAGRAA